jgi:hypothetical protein
MKFRQTLLALGVFVVASASMALADPLSSTVNVSGHDTFSTGSLTFITPFSSTGDTGAAAGFDGGTVNYYLGTVNPLASIGSSLSIFGITDGSGDALMFYSTNNAASFFTDPTTGFLDLTNDETGYYTLSDGSVMSGYFNVTFYGTSASGASAGEDFSGTGSFLEPPSIAPEPSSWLLLATAGFALIGTSMASRRLQLQRVKA